MVKLLTIFLMAFFFSFLAGVLERFSNKLHKAEWKFINQINIAKTTTTTTTKLHSKFHTTQIIYGWNEMLIIPSKTKPNKKTNFDSKKIWTHTKRWLKLCVFNQKVKKGHHLNWVCLLWRFTTYIDSFCIVKKEKPKQKIACFYTK